MPQIKEYLGGAVSIHTETPEERRREVEDAQDRELDALRQIPRILQETEEEPWEIKEKQLRPLIAQYMSATKDFKDALLRDLRKEVCVFGRPIIISGGLKK